MYVTKRRGFWEDYLSLPLPRVHTLPNPNLPSSIEHAHPHRPQTLTRTSLRGQQVQDISHYLSTLSALDRKKLLVSSGVQCMWYIYVMQVCQSRLACHIVLERNWLSAVYLLSCVCWIGIDVLDECMNEQLNSCILALTRTECLIELLAQSPRYVFKIKHKHQNILNLQTKFTNIKILNFTWKQNDFLNAVDNMYTTLATLSMARHHIDCCKLPAVYLCKLQVCKDMITFLKKVSTHPRTK